MCPRIDRSRRGDQPRAWWQKAVFLAVAATVALAVLGSGTAIAFLVINPPLNDTPPVISGTPEVGSTLSCFKGTWFNTTASTVYTYQWNRNGEAIAGATADTYAVTSDDVNQQITCTVTATEPLVPPPASATSSPVTGQAPASGGSTPGGGGGGGESGTPPGGGSEPVALPAASEVVDLPSNKRCFSKRNFRIQVRQIAGVTYLSVEVYVNKKKVKTVKGERVKATVDLRGLPKGRFAAKIVAKTTDGRTITHSRKYRTCSKRRPGKKHPL